MDEGTQKSKDILLWLVPTIALLYLIWNIAVKIGILGDFAQKLELSNLGNAQWDYLGVLLFIILIVILIFQIPTKEEVSAPTPQQQIVQEEIPEVKEVVQIEEQKVEVLEEIPNIISYPKEVSGGIYNDTIIQFGANDYLKLKTMIAKWNEETNELEVL